MDKDRILELYYAHQGDLRSFGELLDKEFAGAGKRKLSMFEQFVRSRLKLHPGELKLVNMDVTEEEAVFLSVYPSAQSVVELDLRQNRIGDRGVAAIACSPVIRSLVRLDLRSNGITRAGIQALLDSDNLSGLKSLDLRSNPLSGKTWADKLKASAKLASLADIRI